MFRVKDPKVSIKFYEDILGMKLIREKRNDAAKFSLFFLAFDHDGSLNDVESKSDEEKTKLTFGREGELMISVRTLLSSLDRRDAMITNVSLKAFWS